MHFFGRLVDIMVSGITVRGIDLKAFDGWVNHIKLREESGVEPATIFFPFDHVEKIIWDEGIGAIPSLSDTFLTKVGLSVKEHLE